MNDPLLQAIDELDAMGKVRDDAWQVPRAEGELLYHIALTMRAETIVEVGTSYGFSALHWARALRVTGGRLHTIDRDPAKYNSSKATFARAGVEHLVTNYLGEAAGVLRSMPGPIDLAFIDADKPGCRGYFETLWPLLRIGGAILTDNATTHRAQLADYVRHVRSLPGASSVEVAVGNGVEWTVKVGNSQ